MTSASANAMREDVPDIPDDIVLLSVADMEFKNAPEMSKDLKSISIHRFLAIRMRRTRIIRR